MILNAHLRLAAIHNIYPRGGGKLWSITPLEERKEVLKKWPERTDLDLNAPFSSSAKPALKVEHHLRPDSRGSWLERSNPDRD